MIKIYIMKTTGWSEPNYFMRGCKEIDLQRRRKLCRLKSTEDKVRSLCCGLLLQYALKKELQQEEKMDFQYDSDANGKPFLPEYPGIHVNLSHSGEYAALVVSDSEVGIDLQKIQLVREGIARKILTEQEMRVFGQETDGEFRQKELIEAWCRKESYGKLTGEGIRRDFSHVHCDMEQKEIGNDGCFHEYFPEEGYTMCVSAYKRDHPVFPETFQTVTFYTK